METGLQARRRSHLSSLLTILAIAVLQGSLTNGQKADVQPEHIVLTEGNSTSLLCRSGTPIGYCRIEMPGESQILLLKETWTPKVPGYKYYGEGWQQGQCGVTIERVSARNHGQVKCTLGIENAELTGFIDVVVALPPRIPVLEIITRAPNNVYQVEDLFRARCSSSYGRPAASLTWYLNEEPITQGLTTPEITKSDNSSVYTTMQELQRRLTASDDGKFLICRSSNVADRGQDNEVKLQLIVRYLPQAQPDIKVYGLTLTRTALINVTIRANPRPRVEWTVDGLTIPQGTQNSRYESYEPVDVGNGDYNVTLSIDALTLEDTTKDYYLKAGNEMGQQEYTIRISSSNTPAASGLDIGAIIGIIVAVAILLIIVVLIIFARATGRWCFGAKSPKTATSETVEAGQRDASVALLSGNPVTSASAIKTTKLSSRPATINPSSSYRDQGVYNPTTIPANDQFIHYVPQVSGSGPPSATGSSLTENSDGGSFRGNNNNETSAYGLGRGLGIPPVRNTRWSREQQKEILQQQAQLRTNRGSVSTDIY